MEKDYLVGAWLQKYFCFHKANSNTLAFLYHDSDDF